MGLLSEARNDRDFGVRMPSWAFRNESSDAMGFELTLSRWSLPPSNTEKFGALRQAVGQ